MKAMILAAGKGTRLLPLTENLPKCLMPLAGRPLIDWQLSWLKKHGVADCIINLHHLPDRVRAHVGDGRQHGLRVEFSFEPDLLGTAGAVKKVADFFLDAPFFVIYGDNFSRWNLEELRRIHDKTPTAGVVAVHWREDVTQSGMVEKDASGRILRYVEKPRAEAATSHWVNAGFYYLDPKVLDFIPDGRFSDFSYDVFPALLRAGHVLHAARMEDSIIGIDTLEAYKRADEDARTIGTH